MNKTKLALFDVDGTVYKGRSQDSHFDFIQFLSEDEKVPKNIGRKAKELLQFLIRETQKYKQKKISHYEWTKAFHTGFAKIVKGENEAEFRKHITRFVEMQAKNRGEGFFYGAKLLIEKLKENGIKIAAISFTPTMIIEELLPSLGFEKEFGVDYKVNKKGEFTGEFEKKIKGFKSRKLELAREWFSEKTGENTKKLIFLGDSTVDYEAAKEGKAKFFAINPGKELQEICRKEKIKQYKCLKNFIPEVNKKLSKKITLL